MNEAILYIGMAAVAVVVLLFKLVASLRAYIMHERAVIRMVDRGEVPADYSIVKTEQEMRNKVDEVGSFAERQSDDHKLRRSSVDSVRQRVAGIRVAGYDAGKLDHKNGMSFEFGVICAPYKKGSGEAKQWVRGYCMGRNVRDIKQYYKEA